MLITTHTLPLPPGVIGSARYCDHQLEPCHRYLLVRELAEHACAPLNCRTLTCIGMNPSSAVDDRDDSTIRVLWNMAAARGYCRLSMVNAYGYRATNPADMRAAGDQAVGQRNDSTILTEAVWADHVFACWGIIDRARDQQLRKLLGSTGIKHIYCLGLTKAGYPKHPLRKAIKGVEWSTLPIGSARATVAE